MSINEVHVHQTRAVHDALATAPSVRSKPISIGTRQAVELVRFVPRSTRGDRMFDALNKAASAEGLEVIESPYYAARAPWLMLWGPGAPERRDVLQRHVAAGGHVIAWDLSYWSREEKMRVSIDAAHPQAWLMRKTWPVDRLAADAPEIEDAWNAKGPVVIAGLGEKATVQYGAATVREWEADMIAEAKRRGYPVHYRPKRFAEIPAGVAHAGTGRIEDAIRGAALVITWHSNVAVDAIRLGIPVICRDGAAAAVCPSDWPAYGQLRPLAAALRRTFLTNLAWFQWAPSEARGCWRFLTELLA